MRSACRWLLASAIAILAGCSQTEFPDRPLYAGLERENYASGSRLIEGRLRAGFPKGSAQNALVNYLRSQSMRVELAKLGGSAQIDNGKGLCGSVVMVHWATDTTDRIAQIDARYTDTGCP